MSNSDELLKLKMLLDDGVLTQSEFNEQKSRILGYNNIKADVTSQVPTNNNDQAVAMDVSAKPKKQFPKWSIVLIAIGAIIIFGTVQYNVAANNNVNEVESKISNLGTISLDSEAVIREVRAAYDELDKKDKVSNYQILVQAEKELTNLQKIAAEEEKQSQQISKKQAVKQIVGNWYRNEEGMFSANGYYDFAKDGTFKHFLIDFDGKTTNDYSGTWEYSDGYYYIHYTNTETTDNATIKDGVLDTGWDKYYREKK